MTQPIHSIDPKTGTQSWYLNGQLHRLDGPAIIESNGTEIWYQYGVLHREDGPALIYTSGILSWYLNGISIPSYTFTQSIDLRQQILDFQRFAIIYLVHNS